MMDGDDLSGRDEGHHLALWTSPILLGLLFDPVDDSGFKGGGFLSLSDRIMELLCER